MLETDGTLSIWKGDVEGLNRLVAATPDTPPGPAGSVLRLTGRDGAMAVAVDGQEIATIEKDVIRTGAGVGIIGIGLVATRVLAWSVEHE